MAALFLACALAMSGGAAVGMTPSDRCCGEPGLPACGPFRCPPLDPRPQYERIERVEAFPVEIGGKLHQVRFRLAQVIVREDLERDSTGCPYYTLSAKSGVTAVEVLDPSGRVLHRLDLRGEVGGRLRAFVLEGEHDRGLLLAESVGEDLDVASRLTLIADRGAALAPAGPAITIRGFVPALTNDPSQHRPERVRLGAADTLRVELETLFNATCTFTVDWLRGIQVPQDVSCDAPAAGAAEEGGEIVLFDEPRADAQSTALEVAPGTSVQGSRARGSVRVGTDGAYELSDDDLWLMIDVAGRRGWLHRPEDFGLLGLIEDRC